MSRTPAEPGPSRAGRQAGGPAKVEVISSALFGTISGSSTANVFATGSFTIPAMIKLGYRRHFAAGVEALLNSTAGLTSAAGLSSIGAPRAT